MMIVVAYIQDAQCQLFKKRSTIHKSKKISSCPGRSENSKLWVRLRGRWKVVREVMEAWPNELQCLCAKIVIDVYLMLLRLRGQQLMLIEFDINEWMMASVDESRLYLSYNYRWRLSNVESNS